MQSDNPDYLTSLRVVANTNKALENYDMPIGIIQLVLLKNLITSQVIECTSFYKLKCLSYAIPLRKQKQ